MAEKVAKYKVVFIRHGESSWNKENRFTGWTDVPLSNQGSILLIYPIYLLFIY